MSVRRKLGLGARGRSRSSASRAPAAQAQVDPSACTQDIQFDPGGPDLGPGVPEQPDRGQQLDRRQPDATSRRTSTRTRRP